MPDEKEFKDLEANAAAGDRAAQGKLGREYLLGSARCVKDEAAAVKWLSAAASHNDPVGCWGMAACCMLGLGGVALDMDTARSLCEKSIEAGCADGFRLRGFQYAKGIGVAKDLPEACRWYKMAADMGDADAQVNLGLMYAEGKGVIQSHAESFRLYRAAADSGNTKARRILGDMFWDGIGIDKDETEAVRLYLLAAEQGDSIARCRLGYAYEEGKGAERDPALARCWYKAAAEQGFILAQYILGEFYAKGMGGAQDYTEAARWYLAAALQGHAGAQARMGLMCYRGTGTARDADKAREWFELAARQGDKEGVRYLKALGDELEPNPAGRGKPALGLRPAAKLLMTMADQLNRETYGIFLILAAEHGYTCFFPRESGETAWCTGLLAIQTKLACAALAERDAGMLEQEVTGFLSENACKESGPFDPEFIAWGLQFWDTIERLLQDKPRDRENPASWTLMRIVYVQLYGGGDYDNDKLLAIAGFFSKVWDAVYPYFFIWDWIRNDFELEFSGTQAPLDNLEPGIIITMKFDPAAWKPTRDYGAVFRVVLMKDLQEDSGILKEGMPWR